MKALIHNMPKKLRCLYILEIVLLFCCIISLLIPGKEYTLLKENSFSETINLGYGRYIVDIEYGWQNSKMTILPIQESSKWYNGLVLSEVQNISNKGSDNKYIRNEHEFELWVTGINSDVRLDIANNNSIDTITIRETLYAKVCVMLVVIFSIIITVLTRVLVKKCLFNRENIIIFIILTACVLICSMPLFTEYTLICFDTAFHMLRIEGIKDGLLSGQFPVKIDPTFLNGYGYATSTYYGNLFLYIPAIMRLLGFTLQFSYKVLIILINALTVWGSYYLFKEIASDKRWGVAGSILYCLSVYRFMDTYYRGALGETIAMAIIPIIALALWNIYTKPYDERYNKRWIPLCLGYTCLIQSHVLSTEIVAAISILICIILWKKTLKKNTLLLLFKFFVVTILLNLGFLVPFIDGIINYKMNITTWSNINLFIQGTGVSGNNLFDFQIPQKNGWDYTTHVYNLGAGFALGLGVIISLLVIFTGTVKNKRDIKKYILWGGLSFITTIMSTIYFPWDRILMFSHVRLGSFGKIIINLINSIQFTYRLLTIATLFMAIFIILAIRMLSRKYNRIAAGLVIGICVIAVIQNVILNSAITMIAIQTEAKLNFINSEDSAHNNYIINGEYFPILDNKEIMAKEDCVDTFYIAENINVIEYNKEYTNINARVSNPTSSTGKLTVPLIYYPGYSAIDKLTGESIEVQRSAKGRVEVIVEPGRDYDISIAYNGKNIWKLAEVVSIITFIYIIITMIDLYKNRFWRSFLYAFKKNTKGR